MALSLSAKQGNKAVEAVEGSVGCAVLCTDLWVSLHNPTPFSEEVPGADCARGCIEKASHPASPLAWAPPVGKCSLEKVSLGIMVREK